MTPPRPRHAGLLALPAVLAAVIATVTAAPAPAPPAPAPPAPADEPAAPVTFTALERKRILRLSPLPPPPPPSTNAVGDDPRAAALGQSLFFDTRLSGAGDRACATCHVPALGFTDGRPLAEGRVTLTRHTPTLWNVAYNRWYFWDGRADSLWAQAVQPIENPDELVSGRLEVAHLVAADAGLRTAYTAIFGPLPPLEDTRRFPLRGRPVPGDPSDPAGQAYASMDQRDRAAVTTVFVNLTKSIAAYERRLLSRHAPFDTFVEGLRAGDPVRQAALSPAARRGLKIFLGPGRCVLCHRGPAFSDGEFHDTRIAPLHGGVRVDTGRYGGVPKLKADVFNAAGPYSDDRHGRAARRLEFLANGPQQWGNVKTPTLRNVALTAPYMHQGQLATLEEVVQFYSTLARAVPADHHDETILRPRHFTARQSADLVAFLLTLTDDGIDPALLEKPEGPGEAAAERSRRSGGAAE